MEQNCERMSSSVLKIIIKSAILNNKLQFFGHLLSSFYSNFVEVVGEEGH